MEAKRRRMDHEPGESFTYAEKRVALLMLNTYNVTLRAHTNTLRSEDHLVHHGRFASDLGEMPSMKLKRSDNPEEQSKDGKEKGKHLIWLQAAQRCIANCFDPEMFVRAQFATLGLGDDGDRHMTKPPRPEAMLSDAAEKNYYIAQELQSQEIAVAFKFQQTKYTRLVSKEAANKSCVDSEDAWARVLSDDDAELSALFRYCLAVSIANDKARTKNSKRFQRISDDYALPAALQYIVAVEDYNEIWRNWIPADFEEDARALYRKYHGASSES